MRIEEWTVGELADLAGVTVRLLHHYDAIGLLRPARVAGNGYRLYRRAEAERLRDILALRQAGLSLAAIAEALAAPGNRATVLRRHRQALVARAATLQQTIAALDRMITQDGGRMMTERTLSGMGDALQARRRAWIEANKGQDWAEVLRASDARWKDAPQGIAAQMEALRAIEAALVADHEGGLPPEAADMAPHAAWIGTMWNAPVTADRYAGLAGFYLDSPEFRARYEALSAGFAEWLAAAMRAHAGRMGPG